MQIISSKLRIGLDSRPIEPEKVKRIKLGVNDPLNPRLWILYFYGIECDQVERLIGMWFYNSEGKRSRELRQLGKKYPHIEIVKS